MPKKKKQIVENRPFYSHICSGKYKYEVKVNEVVSQNYENHGLLGQGANP